MKNCSLIILFIIFFSSETYSQVSINTSGNAPDNSAMLDVQSTSKGVLFPRMTSVEIATLSDPANGLVVFCTSDDKFYVFIAGDDVWKEILYGSGTIAPVSCGAPMTISHEAGPVAPVTKTVTYGTVTNIPGEPAKCWITSNLGADQQATSVSDNTEASAGWYWQFNRMQGYKHDGTTRTPNTTWITSIVEDADWLAANDPCSLELENGWRIPTVTEWINVSVAGAWTDWNGPWNSDLKIHAAGRLLLMTGALAFRGTDGYYWSSSQFSSNLATYMYFNSDLLNINTIGKAAGISVRCVRE